MTRTVRILGIVLVLQIALAVLLYWQQQPGGNSGQAGKLLAFSPDKLTQIQIIGKDNKTLELEKTAQGWTLPGYYGLPVDEAKRMEFVQKLLTMNWGWPISTTKSSIGRFEVDVDHFQRHILFKDGDRVLGEVYLGTSPGFRKVHARVAGDQAVYAIPFNNYEATTEAKAWMDHNILKPGDTLTRIEGNDFVLEKTEGKWHLADTGPQVSTDVGQAEKLASLLQGLVVLEVADDTSRDKLKDQSPAFHYKVTTPIKEVLYQFYRDGKQTFVRSSDRDQLFRIDSYTADNLGSFKHDILVKVDAAAKPNTTTTEPVQETPDTKPDAETAEPAQESLDTKPDATMTKPVPETPDPATAK